MALAPGLDPQAAAAQAMSLFRINLYRQRLCPTGASLPGALQRVEVR